MALLGQASGGFTESSSALRLLHVGIRNTVGVLTTDSFTQTNPPIISTSNGGTTGDLISSQCDTSVLGVLSGSIAFSRPDEGENEIGGPDSSFGTGCTPLGVFINNAVGYSYENVPASASGKGPYTSAQGCYANGLYEDYTQTVVGYDTTTAATGVNPVTAYAAGQNLYAGINGYLTNLDTDSYEWCAAVGPVTTYDVTNAANVIIVRPTVIGILKMAPDSTQDELVYDQRI